MLDSKTICNERLIAIGLNFHKQSEAKPFCGQYPREKTNADRLTCGPSAFADRVYFSSVYITTNYCCLLLYGDRGVQNTCNHGSRALFQPC